LAASYPVGQPSCPDPSSFFFAMVMGLMALFLCLNSRRAEPTKSFCGKMGEGRTVYECHKEAGPICRVPVFVICPIHMVGVVSSHLMTWN
jgi:hypothetical protein